MLRWLPLGALGLPLSPFGEPLAPFGRPLGSLLLALGSPGAIPGFSKNEHHFCEQMCQNHCKTQQDIAFWNLPAEAPEAPEAAEVVSASAAQTPLSHVLGVRMTGVRKLPQITCSLSLGPQHNHSAPMYVFSV